MTGFLMQHWAEKGLNGMNKPLSCLRVMLYPTCYHFYNLKKVKNTHGGVLLLEVTLLDGCFSRFLDCTNGTKSGKASRIFCMI